MKNIKKLYVLLIALTLCSFFISCGSGSKFVGNWICKEVHSGYPDQMILNNDGTGIVDGASCSWRNEDGKLILSVGILGSYDYDYEFRGSKLYLAGYEYAKK